MKDDDEYMDVWWSGFCAGLMVGVAVAGLIFCSIVAVLGFMAAGGAK